MNNQIDQITASSLLEDLKSTESNIRINAIKGLQGISFALGRERTRKELLPFLMNLINEEEDDNVLIELAKVLTKFLDCIGGKVYVKELFNLIEAILSVNQTKVIDEAIFTLEALLAQLNFTTVEKDMLELISRLCLNEKPIKKNIGINVIMMVFKGLQPSNKTIVLNYLIEFCSSELTVKQKLSSSLPLICVSLEKDILIKILEILIACTGDQEETIRINVVDTLVLLEKHPLINDFYDFIDKTIKKLAVDKNKNVRMIIADKTHNFLSFNGITSNLTNTIIESFINFFDDTEEQVRNTCCQRLEQIAYKIGKEEVFNKVLEKLINVEKDQTVYVRGSLANSLLKICPMIGTKRTNDYIIPIFLKLMNDENHDIRISLIQNLDKLNEVVHIDDNIQGILPSFTEIGSNKSWRIRIQISKVMPVIAKIINKKVFMENIYGICIALLTDPVFAIRESGCNLMKILYRLFKGEDFENRLIDKLIEMTQSPSYLVRNTVVFLIKEFTIEDDLNDFVEKKLYPIFISLSKDDISNVRLTCASIIKRLLKVCKEKNNITQLQLIIEEYKKDKDCDVVNMLNSTK